MKPAKREQSTAWELRGYWASGREVRVTLGKHCMIQTIVGLVTRVSVTGAFAILDGWHVPCAEILATGRPTIQDRQDYLAVMDRLRRERPAEMAA